VINIEAREERRINNWKETSSDTNSRAVILYRQHTLCDGCLVAEGTLQ